MFDSCRGHTAWVRRFHALSRRPFTHGRIGRVPVRTAPNRTEKGLLARNWRARNDRPTCHAEGRGFEPRRSRYAPWRDQLLGCRRRTDLSRDAELTGPEIRFSREITIGAVAVGTVIALVITAFMGFPIRRAIGRPAAEPFGSGTHRNEAGRRPTATIGYGMPTAPKRAEVARTSSATVTKPRAASASSVARSGSRAPTTA